MTDPYRSLIEDLAAEHEALDAVVAPLAPGAWDTATPADGWSVRDQIGHLTYFDQQAVLSATDEVAFLAGRDRAIADLDSFEALTLDASRRAEPAAVLAAWRAGRHGMLDVLSGLAAKDRLEWYGPPMSAMSFATARLMETWAHGQDVVDAVGAERPPTDRLRHIAHLGVRTRGFSYAVRGRKAPVGDVRVELGSPSGERWTWSDPDAPDRVTGSAQDFCLLVTQRRHRSDTDLQVRGDSADEWLDLAQAFAGGPGPGRRAQGSV